MNDDIRFILENALLAPSGDNNQPWHWVVRGNELELWDESPDDLVSTLYSGTHHNGRSSMVTFGTMIENAALAATTRGIRTDVAYLPDPTRPTLAAVLILVRDENVLSDPLASGIAMRITNRKPYRREPLTANERTMLLAADTNEACGEIKLLDDRQSVAALARVGSLNDEIIFGDKELHDYIFSHINWTKREDARRRTGFYFPTLAAPPFSWGAMQLLRHWWIMRIGIVFRLHKVIAMEQRFVYRSAGAYGIVLARGNSPVDWMRAGRLIERLWIAANNIGLSMHPMNGTLLFAGNADTEEGKRIFSLEQRRRLKESRAEVARLFGIEDKAIAFMFRIGHGKPPSARTSRRPFEQMVDVINA